MSIQDLLDNLDALPVIPEQLEAAPETERKFPVVRSLLSAANALESALSEKDLPAVKHYLARMQELGFQPNAASVISYRLGRDGASWEAGADGEASFALKVLRAAKQNASIWDVMKAEPQNYPVMSHAASRGQWGAVAFLANEGFAPTEEVVKQCLAADNFVVLKKLELTNPGVVAQALREPWAMAVVGSQQGLEAVARARQEVGEQLSPVDVFNCLKAGKVGLARALVEDMGVAFPRDQVTLRAAECVLALGAKEPQEIEFLKKHFFPDVQEGALTGGARSIVNKEMLRPWLDSKPKELTGGFGLVVKALAGAPEEHALEMLTELKVIRGMTHSEADPSTALLDSDTVANYLPEYAARRDNARREAVLLAKVFGPDNAFKQGGINDLLMTCSAERQLSPHVQALVDMLKAEGIEVDSSKGNVARALLLEPALNPSVIGVGHGEIGTTLRADPSRLADKTREGYTAAEILLTRNAWAECLLTSAEMSAPQALEALRAATRERIDGKPAGEWLAAGDYLSSGIGAPDNGKAGCAGCFEWVPSALVLGADLTALTAEGKTLAQVAIESRTDEWRTGIPSQNAHGPAIAEMLNAPNAKGETALHVWAQQLERNASAAYSVGFVVELISAGANPLLRDKQGRTALDIANEVTAGKVLSRGVCNAVGQLSNWTTEAQNSRILGGDLRPRLTGLSEAGTTVQTKIELHRDGKPPLDVTEAVVDIINAKSVYKGRTEGTTCVLQVKAPALADLPANERRAALEANAAKAIDQQLQKLDKEKLLRVKKAVEEQERRAASRAKAGLGV